MKKISFLIGLCIFIMYPSYSQTQNKENVLPRTPLNMQDLQEALSYARPVLSDIEGEERPPDNGWPRTISYDYEIYDYSSNTFSRETRTFEMHKKPMRIIPHAVGVTEILWAICPRKRIIAFHEFAADPNFSIIAEAVKRQEKLFTAKQTELIIGYQPDLVFTVFYSGAEFKAKLKQAGIPFFDLGYFGTIESIKRQILLIGKVIGEEINARTLVKTIDEKIEELTKNTPVSDPPKRIVFYDEGGYVPGKSSNFTSMCEMINVVNIGAEQGITSWSQIDYETLLKWDPDVIIVPQASQLKQQLLGNKLLAHARAVKEGRVYTMPAPYLLINSQYMVLSANALAGIVYQ